MMFSTTADLISWLTRGRPKRSGPVLELRNMSGKSRQDLDFSAVEHVQTERGGRVMVTHVAVDAIVVGILTPKAARAEALRLLDSAARADYEDDFSRAAFRRGYSPEQVSEIMSTIRRGEHARRQMDAAKPPTNPGEGITK